MLPSLAPIGLPLCFIIVALYAAFWASPAAAAVERQTVCTITVNSSDERQVFRRYLPPDRFRFVELVERGRPDWLASARRKGIRCDIVIISGHYDGGDYAGGNEFFSEHVDTREYLRVDEMERVACSSSDDGLFSRVRAVFLFGCNTLNPVVLRSAPDEIARMLRLSGHAPAEAERLARVMSSRFADSSRDRMRHIFRNVPAIFGFSSVAPLGPLAATYLDRYFRAGGAREIASGTPGPRLLGYFPGHSLTLTRGSRDVDPDAAFRRDVCGFLDARLSPVQRALFVHRLLGRDMAEVRLFLDRIERYVASLPHSDDAPAGLARALRDIADDAAARARYLRFMRALGDPSLQMRMIDVAEGLGWLSPAARVDELERLIVARYGDPGITAGDVDFVCRLNDAHALDGARGRLSADPAVDDTGHAAMLACLGAPGARPQVLQALTGERVADAQIAQVYLRYRPIRDVHELRQMTSSLLRTADVGVQLRGLDTLSGQQVTDADALSDLAQLFQATRSVDVQRAIAGVLLRTDYDTLDASRLLAMVREYRLTAGTSRDVIDVLIEQLARWQEKSVAETMPDRDGCTAACPPGRQRL